MNAEWSHPNTFQPEFEFNDSPPRTRKFAEVVPPISAKQFELVRQAQRALNQVLGLRLPVTGIVHRNTRKAVRRFQRQRRLRPDGFLSPQTRRALLVATRAAQLQSRRFEAPANEGFQGEMGFRTFPQRFFQPLICRLFLPANPSSNYEDYVNGQTTGRFTLFNNGRNSGGTGPDIDQSEAFDTMQKAVEVLKAEDSICLAAWHFDQSVPLTLTRAGMKTWGDLFQKKAKDGVKIRIIMTDFDPIAKVLRAKLYRDFLPGLNKLIDKLDPAKRDNLKYIVSRHPATQFTKHVATHHQKFMIVKTGGATTAFCGGLDIAYMRTPAYWKAANYQWLWHDIHPKLDGLITLDLEKEFVLRWNREKGSSVVVAQKGWKPYETLVQSAARPADKKPDNNTQKLQMLRTVSVQGAGWRSIQQTKRDDVLQGYLRLIGCANEFIFMENQYFRELRLADAIVNRAKVKPELIVIIVVPNQLDDPDDPIKQHGNFLQHEFFDRLNKALGTKRLRVYTMFRRIIHSKIIIVDDRALSLGSANANPRGFFLDTELNVLLENWDAVASSRHHLWSQDLGVSENTIAGWKVSDFFPRWDAIAKSNLALTKKSDDMSGEGVIPFDPLKEKGQKQTIIHDVLTEVDRPGHTRAFHS